MDCIGSVTLIKTLLKYAKMVFYRLPFKQSRLNLYKIGDDCNIDYAGDIITVLFMVENIDKLTTLR